MNCDRHENWQQQFRQVLFDKHLGHDGQADEQGEHPEIECQHQGEAGLARHPGLIEWHGLLREEEPVSQQDRDAEPEHNLDQKMPSVPTCRSQGSNDGARQAHGAEEHPFAGCRRALAGVDAGDAKDPARSEVLGEGEGNPEPRNQPEQQQRQHSMQAGVGQAGMHAAVVDAERDCTGDCQRQAGSAVHSQIDLVAIVACDGLADEVEDRAFSRTPDQRMHDAGEKAGGLFSSARGSFDCHLAHAYPGQGIGEDGDCCRRCRGAKGAVCCWLGEGGCGVATEENLIDA
jgi:hypothetical protein